MVDGDTGGVTRNYSPMAPRLDMAPVFQLLPVAVLPLFDLHRQMSLYPHLNAAYLSFRGLELIGDPGLVVGVLFPLGGFVGARSGERGSRPGSAPQNLLQRLRKSSSRGGTFLRRS